MQNVHPKAKKKKRQRKKPTFNMREANKFFTGMEQRIKQKEPEQPLTKSERHVAGMKLTALRLYLTSTMDVMNQKALLKAMRVLIAGMSTKVGRKCALVFLAHGEEAAGEAEEEAEEEAAEEEAEEEAGGEEDGSIWCNPDWIKSKSGTSQSGFKGVTPDRGRWKCTVGGKTVGRCDTIGEAADMYLAKWTRARNID